jgi:hypothetical protein
MDVIERIETLLNSLCNLLYIGTANHSLMVEKCIEIASRHSMEFYIYNISEGIRRPKGKETKNNLIDPIEMLNEILDLKHKPFQKQRKLFLLGHFDMLIENKDPLLLTKLRLINDNSYHQYSVIMMGRPYLKLPEIIADIPKIMVLTLSNQDIRAILRECQEDLSEDKIKTLTKSLQGLTALECENVLSLCLVKKGALDTGFIKRERELLLSERAQGLIELCKPDSDLGHVAGLDVLKGWLLKRGDAVNGMSIKRNKYLSDPKGVILTGPPGCGKSYLVSSLAGTWGVNLIKLYPPRLFSSLVGDTEKNLFSALDTVKSLAPAILWIDEFEKFFPQSTGIKSDGGVMSRVLGLFLDFLQSRRDGVFVCATTNSISVLPQEIMRAGRFDAVFFVDLPNRHEREAILKVILKKYGIKKQILVDDFMLEATENFSGAEIEQAVIDTLYESDGLNRKVNTFTLLSIINVMIPLAQTMEEEISQMRQWCISRTRFASALKK